MNWIRALMARRQHERDLSDEITQHLDEKVEALMAAGVSRREAELAAHRAFGSVALTSERGRAVWRWALVEDFWADLRYATRQLRRTPSFAFAAILTLAAGIGVNTAIFSIVDAIVLRPLPFPQPERLASVELLDVRGGPHPASVSYFTFFEFRRAEVFERMASFRDGGLTLTGRTVPVPLAGQIVSADFFDVLGVTPAIGRGFLRAEEQPGVRVVVLSHDVWTAHFAADPSILDKPVSINGEPFSVVGVAPPAFNFPMRQQPVQIWTTLARDGSPGGGPPLTEQRGARVLEVVGRLRPGMSMEEAHARMDAVAAGLAKREPDSNRNQPATYVKPELHRMLGGAREPMLILWGAVSLVLLMACANIANMLLGRTADRERELGVRLAIGGSRMRVVRQLLTENLLLALVGGAVGVAIAIGVVSALGPIVADQIPRGGDVRIDASVLAFTLALAFATATLVSIPAALWLRRIDVNPARPGTSRGGAYAHDGVRSALVVAQVAVGLVLLSGAALLAASFLHVATRDPGFRPDGLLAFNIAAPGTRYKTADSQLDLIARLLERLRAAPGVSAATAAMPLPLQGHEMRVGFDIVDRPAPPSERPRSDMAIVTPGYFATIGTRVVAGRDFTEQDDDDHPRVLIVNQAFADRYFPGEQAIGKRVEPGTSSARDAREGGRRIREIVGIVGNARQDPLGRDADPIYYFPLKQLPWGPPAFIVRTSSEELAIESDIRKLVAAIEPEAPVHSVRSLPRMLASGMALPRLLTLLVGGFSLIALLLTATGLYGVLAYAVMRRTREIGVRLALGATRGRVVGMVLRRALLLVAIGVPLGALGAVAVQSLLRTIVLAPAANGPGLLIAAIAVVVLTATAAACAPAMRAASIDPVRALRTE